MVSSGPVPIDVLPSSVDAKPSDGPVSPLSPLSPFGPCGPLGPCGPMAPPAPLDPLAPLVPLVPVVTLRFFFLRWCLRCFLAAEAVGPPWWALLAASALPLVTTQSATSAIASVRTNLDMRFPPFRVKRPRRGGGARVLSIGCRGEDRALYLSCSFIDPGPS